MGKRGPTPFSRPSPDDDADPATFRLAAADKDAVRASLLDAASAAPPAARPQLADCVARVAAADWPAAWPALVPALAAGAASRDPPRVAACLLGARALCRKYEFRAREGGDKAALEGVVAALFPGVRAVAAAAVASRTADPAAADLAKLALKCFWSATYVGVPAPLLEPGELGAWLETLLALVSADPPPGAPPDPDDRAEWPWWKLRKWALHIVNRLAARYGDPRLTRAGAPDRALADAWTATGAGDRFLDAVLGLLARWAGGAWVSPRCLNLALSHCGAVAPLARAWRALKPHAPALIASVALPAACFDDRDAALWAEDPAEYVRRGSDVLEELYSPKSAAVNLVVELCRARASTCLPPTMAALGAVFAEVQAAGGGGALDASLARRADGALLLVGALAGVVARKPAYKAQVEPLLQTVVLPLFACPHGHVRAKACWVAARFADFDFAAGAGRGPTFDALFAAAGAAMADPDLPVRVEAAGAVRHLVDALDESGLPAFRAALPALLRTLLSLMAELDSEELVSALESAVDRAGPGIAPYAAELASQLVSAYDRMTAAAATSDAGSDDDAAIASFAVLRALVTVVDAVATAPGAVASLEPVLLPLLARLLADDDGHDAVDEAFDLLSYVTHFSPSVSPAAWALFPALTDAAAGWARDYLDGALPAIANYVARAPDAFLEAGQGAPTRLERVLAVARSALANPDGGDDEVIPAPRLLTLVLQACPGRVDGAVGAIVGLALDALASRADAGDDLRDALIGAVAAAFHYSPGLALHALAARGAADAFLGGWVQRAGAVRKPRGGGAPPTPRHFRRGAAKTLCVLGLAAAAAAPPGALPPGLDADRTPLVAAALPQLTAWRAKQAASAAAAAAGSTASSDGGAWSDPGSASDGDGDGDATADVGASDGSGSDDGVSAAYVRRLAAAAARRAGGGAGSEDDSEDEDGWSDSDDEAETPATRLDPGAALVRAAETARAAGRLAADAGLAAALTAAAAEAAAAEAAAAAKGGA